MAKFLLAYRAPKVYNPGPTVMADWNAYFAGLGSALVEIGDPVFDRRTVGRDVADTVLGGYSVIVADDLEAAVALANGCPLLDDGGAVEVGAITQLDRS